MTYPCEIQEQAAQFTLSIRFSTPVQQIPQRLGSAYQSIGEYIARLGEQPAGGVFAAYYNMDMEALDIEAGFTVAKRLPGKGEIQASEIPAGTFAVCHYTGAYDAMSPAYEALTEFAKANGYEPGGVAYEWYFSEPDTPPQDTKTDIAFAVTRIGEHAAI